MARSEYREDVKTSLEGIIDSIESDVNDIMSIAEDVKEILGKGEGGLSFREVDGAMSKVEELIDMLRELADKLF